MLAGEIAFSTSTLKRLVEQSVDDPESTKTQVLLFESCLLSLVIFQWIVSPVIFCKSALICFSFT
jgi:hypothetical protein